MFIQHKQLTSLNVLAKKVAHLHSASSRVQLAFSGYSPQLCQAYLLQILSGNKVLVVVAFYLTESRSSIFFVPRSGESTVEGAEAVYEEGFGFVESMGFALIETDYHLLSESKKQSYWKALPICKLPSNEPVNEPVAVITAAAELKDLRLHSLKSLGRFFASM